MSAQPETEEATARRRPEEDSGDLCVLKDMVVAIMIVAGAMVLALALRAG